jgi:cytidine deaminase
MVDKYRLVRAAQKTAQFAYAPYSGLSVGAAISFIGTDKIYTGCNVENRSYGLTICAERSAICAGVSAGYRHISCVALAVYEPSGALAVGSVVPCGACLQFISEFSSSPQIKDVEIFVAGGGSFKLSDLLPQKFSIT